MESWTKPNQAEKILQKESRKIGNYLIGRTLGEGTFGKVKVAVHTPTNEKVR
jgi:serine/threonine protein kinase